MSLPEKVELIQKIEKENLEKTKKQMEKEEIVNETTQN